MAGPRNTARNRLVHQLCAFKRNERGASAIEFAMIATFFMLMMVMVVDYALIMYRKMELTAAVRAGTQYALVNTSSATDAVIQAAVTGSTTLSGVTVTVDSNLCGCSDGSTFACDAVGATCDTPATTGRIHRYTDITASYTYTWLFPEYNSGTKVIYAHSSIRTK